MKNLPSWVGDKKHIWTPQLGGGIWYAGLETIKSAKPVFSEYPRPFLVGLRGDVKDHGYRFDLDFWSPNAESYNYWVGRCAAEHVLKLLEGGNCEFMWSMPTPWKFSANPYAADAPKGSAYPWQTAEYYAAYLEYLTKPATIGRGLARLNTNYSFFTDDTCKTINKESEAALRGNWGNLRARRGHVAPYPIQAVILGVEPYGDAQECTQVGGNDSGKFYGEIVVKYHTAIKKRGINIPLGLNIAGNVPMTDDSRPWFKPLFDTIKDIRKDFSLLDMHHHYHFGEPANECNRIFPTMVNNATIGGGVQSQGWQQYWLPKSSWPAGVDYSKYLWMYDDVRCALKKIGEDPDRWKLGCAEHGLAITSRFKGNDMGAGIHWALWLAESMRYNAVWDMNWNAIEIGFSHAQIQMRDGFTTRTPAHYVYKMAQMFHGFQLRDNSYISPLVSVGKDAEASYKSDDVVVRVFEHPVTGNIQLFVINKNETKEVQIPGWESWQVVSWKILKADKFTDQNPIGAPWTPEKIRMTTFRGAAHPLRILPISVNCIELTPRK